MEKFDFIPRDSYIKKIFRLLNNQNLLLIVGVRRAGKSCLAAQLEQELRNRDAGDGRVVRYNFETMDEARVTADELIDRFQENYARDKKNYIILDEITHVISWEKAVNRIGQLENCKLILLSSNRRVVSAELTAVQEKRYDLLHALPLSLEEFIRFQGFQETTDEYTPFLQKQYRRFDGGTYTLGEIYRYYAVYGGFPIMKPQYMDQERAWVVADGTYSAIVTRDILELGNYSGTTSITDPVLLRSVITIMARHIGDNISATWVGKQTAQYLQRPSSTKTIESYMRAMLNANLFYISERYDIRSEQVMKTLAKYYIADAALHNYLTGKTEDDERRLLENKVFFELLRRGYQVYNGKIGAEEIDLVAMRQQERLYIQVAKDVTEENFPALVSPLKKLRDYHPRVIIALNRESEITKGGISIVNALEFLTGHFWQR